MPTVFPAFSRVDNLNLECLNETFCRVCGMFDVFGQPNFG